MQQVKKSFSIVMIALMILSLITPYITTKSYAGNITASVDSEIKDNYGWTHAFGVSYNGVSTYGFCTETSESTVQKGAATATQISNSSAEAKVAYYGYTHSECYTAGSGWVYAISSALRQVLTGDPVSSHYESDKAQTILNNAGNVPDNIEVYHIYWSAQDIVFCITKPTGNLTLKKQCDPAYKDLDYLNCSGYSLKGAVYKLYTSYSNAQDDVNSIYTFTTDASGNTGTTCTQYVQAAVNQKYGLSISYPGGYVSSQRSWLHTYAVYTFV